MARKKKNMDGGRLFGLLPNKPIITQEHSTYLNTINKLNQIYKNIDPTKISVNNLYMKVKSLRKFSNTIKNKNNSFQPLLEKLKLQLIEKIKLSVNNFIHYKTSYDYTIPFDKLLDQLLDQLKEFEKLLNQLKLLDNQFNLSFYNPDEQSFIEKILGKYEDYIEQIFRENPNIDILGQLSQQVQKYIRLYTEFIESMTNNRKMTNPIYEIIRRLKIIFDKISIKNKLLSGQGTNINGNQISNEMKRRINLLYDAANRNHKRNNYQSILHKLHVEYQKNPNKYNLQELSILADIGSKIESISRMRNGNNKKILLIDLGKTIKNSKKILGEYPEFKEYERKFSVSL
jgi:hypothetical protein